MIPIWLGNLLWFIGLMAGVVSLLAAGMLEEPIHKFLLLLFSWFNLYYFAHPLAHYLTGRAVGVRFRGYIYSKSKHLALYPRTIADVMKYARFPCIMIDRTLVESVPSGRAVMFLSGDLASILCPIVAVAFSIAYRLPSSSIVIILTILMVILIVKVSVQTGDFAKARGEMKHKTRLK